MYFKANVCCRKHSVIIKFTAPLLFPSFTLSLSFSALSHKVFIRSLTFYFELQYRSISCLPAGLTKGACWTINHFGALTGKARSHSANPPSNSSS